MMGNIFIPTTKYTKVLFPDFNLNNTKIVRIADFPPFHLY
jgi:hypothetical protein